MTTKFEQLKEFIASAAAKYPTYPITMVQVVANSTPGTVTVYVGHGRKDVAAKLVAASILQVDNLVYDLDTKEMWHVLELPKNLIPVNEVPDAFSTTMIECRMSPVEVQFDEPEEPTVAAAQVPEAEPEPVVTVAEETEATTDVVDTAADTVVAPDNTDGEETT